MKTENELAEVEIYEESESAEDEFDYTEEELEAERAALCISQGMSRYC